MFEQMKIQKRSGGNSGPNENVYEAPDGLTAGQELSNDINSVMNSKGFKGGYPTGNDPNTRNGNGMFDTENAPKQFAAGQSAPEEEGGYKQKRRTPGQKNAIFKAVGAVVLMVGFMVYSSGILSRGTGGEKMDMEIQDQMRLQEENAKLKEKYEATERTYNELLNQMPQMVDKQVKEAMKNVDLSGGTSEIASKLDAIQQKQMELEQKIGQSNTAPQEEEVAQPRSGSSGPSMIYTQLNEIKNKRDAEEKELAKKREEDVPAYDNRAGIPTGTFIPAVLKTMVISSTKTDRFHTTAELTEDYEFIKGYYIPKGTKFIGKATPDFDSRRILVDVNMLQYGMAEVKMKGVMTDHRGNPGMVTKYQDPLMQGIPMIAFTNILSAAALSAQRMTTYYNNYSNTYNDRPEFSAENIAWQGVGNAMSNISNTLTQAYTRKQPVILVHNGIKVAIQISEKLPLDVLIDAGVVKEKKEY